ncbi:MAG: DNA mismatch repair protein MutS, partial [Verrucomicrobiota bacterium]
ELTRILTPGTLLGDTQIDERSGSYLLGIAEVSKKGPLVAAWLDLSTGEFCLAAESDYPRLLPMLTALNPREILIPEGLDGQWREREALRQFCESFRNFCEGRALTELPSYQFEGEAGLQAVCEALGVLNLDGFGIGREHPGLGAAGAVVAYATETLCARPENLRALREYRSGETLLLDPATLRNLEVFRTASGERRGSLLAAIDGSATAAGSRLCETYLAAPSLDLAEIGRRQRAVRAFVEEPSRAGELRERLRHVRDIKRILGRLENRIRNPRELGGIRETLRQLPAVAGLLETFESEEILGISQRIGQFDELSDLLESALSEELPGDLADGGLIAEGFDENLDHLRSLTRDNRNWLSDLEAEERSRTGIKNLRLKYNGAFGYFIEITKSQLERVPEDYIRKQTMTNAERFTTEALKQKEKEILNADERAIAREEQLFRELVGEILEQADALTATADALAEADVFAGWAGLAREWDWCEPVVDDSDLLEIEQGRHPVVEQMMREERAGLAGTHSFVPNDTTLSASGEQIALITGPNMAGKSTYIRQVALIALMAQIGCWVPARRCRLGWVDRIFSRVGASDELARGNSTFMVEMNETANILNNATARSLVILDEIGRGTSTYDGLSIAWAVIEHLHKSEKSEVRSQKAENEEVGDTEEGGAVEAGARTLFATHYHELTQLAQTLPRLRNYAVAVKEWNDQIIFVRQVVPGAADRSYGIQVARLAGLPDSVIARAKTLLERLESDSSAQNLLRKRLSKQNRGESVDQENAQLELF